jgi:hypothetical protein
VQRDHERKLARAARLHEQRLNVYHGLGQFLEMERTRIERVEPLMTVGEPRALPPEATDEEWAGLHGSVAVAGSEAVQTALNEFHASVRAFAGHAFTYREIRRHGAGEQVAEAGEKMIEARKVALAKLDETERVMRDELAKL